LSAVPALAKTVKIIVPFAAGGPVDQLIAIVNDKGGA
jgi:tripartite-type tricarboxylate transporter receptor subunit TctC